MTDHIADPDAEAIARCREAIHEHNDLLSVATRDDFSILLNAYYEALERAADAEKQRDEFKATCDDLLRRIAELEGQP